jgi:hypothetical protein
MRVFYIGFPGPCGGANVEMAHTIPVWRRAGIDVTLVPTWGQVSGPIPDRLRALGCQIVEAAPETIDKVPGLAGAICHSMCNRHFWEVFGALKRLGCKTVWSSAMTFEFPETIRGMQQYGPPDALHFQSEFQRQEITRDLAKLGILPREREFPASFLIRGAFDFTDYPFAPRPHEPGAEFFVGRLSRPEQDKWSSNLWPILAAVPYPQRKALAMGWTLAAERKCGRPPAWAQALKPQEIPVPEFLKRCHAMVGLNGGARENWPRIGLEAMAAGVPLVVQKLWGWKEMVQHDETGYLCDNDQDFAFYLALLARDEGLRRRIAEQARAAVERMADPTAIGREWRELFESLSAGPVRRTGLDSPPIHNTEVPSGGRDLLRV